MDERIVTLLPNQHGGGVSFSNEEICAQAVLLADLHVDLIDAISDAQSRHLGIPVHVCRPLVRRAVVPLTHTYFERLLRLLRLRAVWPDVQVPQVLCPATVAHCSQLYSLAGGSLVYNQYILNLLAKACGIPPVLVEVSDSLATKPKMPAGYINHLNIYPGTTLLKRLKWKARTELSRFTGRLVATWLSDTRIPSLEAGLYGWGRFAHMPSQWDLVDGTSSPEMRNAVVNPAVRSASASIHSFLSKCGVEDSDLAGRMVDGFADLMCHMYPTTLLEASPANLEIGIHELSRYKRCKSVLSCGISLTTQASILIGAARTLGIKVIGSQHGGHSGYMDQHTTAIETDYADCDEYVTWGWQTMPDHPAMHSIREFALPSPWFSYRAAYWHRELSDADRFGAGKPFDFAFLPNKVNYFPPGPSGAHATSNHLPQIAAEMKELVTAVSAAGWRMMLKPYGLETTYLLDDTLRQLPIAGGSNFEFSATMDKGITPEMVRRCRILLWDQPGTGFLECLCAGIPTMVLWTRLYNREAPRAVAIFAEFESAGIVHRNIDSLLSAYRDFAAAPAQWSANPSRVSVANRFVREYGWAEDDWAWRWKSFIEERTR